VRPPPPRPVDEPASTGWRRLAWRLYEHLPRAADLPLRIATRALLSVTNRHVDLTVLRGPVASGGSGSMLFAGAPGAAAYVAQRFFAEEPAAEPLGQVPVWRLADALARHRAAVDLVVARLDRVSSALMLDASYVAVPEWIGAHAPVPPDARQFCRDRDSLSHNLKRVERAGYQPCVSHAAADFGAFYDRMYVPFLRRRHGPESIVTNRARLRRCFRQGGVMWALRGGERVAGLLFRTRGRTLDLVALGTVDGALDPARDGGLFALDLFLFEHARTLGCTVVDFGGSRSSPSDGLLLFKARWNARLVAGRTTFYDLCLSWDRFGPPLLAFLARTPLIFRQADGLAALWGPAEKANVHAARHVLRTLRRLYLVGGTDGAPRIDGTPPIIRIDPVAQPQWKPGRVPPPA
jgi:hypothetical protein